MRRTLLPLLLVGCAEDVPPDQADPWTTTTLPEPVRRSGDPDAGWQTLRYGSFVGSGIPLSVWDQIPQAIRTSVLGPPDGNPTGREGDNADVPIGFNVFDAPNGVRVIGGLTCLHCHSGNVAGSFVVGVADPDIDFTSSQLSIFETAAAVTRSLYGEASPEWEAFEPFYRAGVAAAERIVTPFTGVNPAFVLEEIAASHRDPTTVAWLDTPSFEPARPLLASDAPAWWLIRKKNALYHNGMGRGDLGRLLMQIMLPAIVDKTQLEEADPQFDDIYAYLEALQPPAFPTAVAPALVDDGEAIFDATCSACHGTYGTEESYPNLLVHVDEVGTDPAYAERFVDTPNLADWFNGSWLATTATLQPEPGYVAPPLDGVWATAPYFHNGSVPTLAAVLDSASRPAAWRRTGLYDLTEVGLQWEPGEVGLATTYDTQVSGYGSGGHTYGDALSADERTALIAYLTTL